MQTAFRTLALAVSVAAAGCTSVSSNYTADMQNFAAESLVVCHGFDCRRKTKLQLTQSDAGRFAALLGPGSASPASERAAVASAIRYYENRASDAIGVRDGPKSDITQSGQVGQMDCIDESTNTRTVMLYLEKRGMLKHHKVESNVSRGAFVDGRYPHSTAVLRERSGKQWAIDSWYEPMGGAPDILPLDEWKRRGVLGVR